SAGALQLRTEILEKGVVVRQAVHERDGLAAAPLLLHPEPGNHARGDGIAGHALAAALAVFVGPAAAGADAAEAGRVDQTALVAIAHRLIIALPQYDGAMPTRELVADRGDEGI